MELNTLSVLVVEDEPHTRAFVVHSLKKLGIENVIEAETPTEALERDPSFNLLICDWKLASHFDIGVMTEVGVPMITVACQKYRNEALQSTVAGVSDCIVKPFTKDILLSKMKKLLEERHAEE